MLTTCLRSSILTNNLSWFDSTLAKHYGWSRQGNTWNLVVSSHVPKFGREMNVLCNVVCKFSMSFTTPDILMQSSDDGTPSESAVVRIILQSWPTSHVKCNLSLNCACVEIKMSADATAMANHIYTYRISSKRRPLCLVAPSNSSLPEIHHYIE